MNYYFLAAFSCLMLGISILKFRNNFKKAFLWGILWSLIIIVFLIPIQIGNFISSLGFNLPFNIVAMLGLFVCFFIIWHLSIKIDDLNHRLNKMIQEIALER